MNVLPLKSQLLFHQFMTFVPPNYVRKECRLQLNPPWSSLKSPSWCSWLPWSKGAKAMPMCCAGDEYCGHHAWKDVLGYEMGLHTIRRFWLRILLYEVSSICSLYIGLMVHEHGPVCFLQPSANVRWGTNTSMELLADSKTTNEVYIYIYICI